MARLGGIGVLSVAALVNVGGASSACGGITTEACLEGTEACICRSDGSCDSGLSCRSNLCIVPDNDGTGGRPIVNEPVGSGGSGASVPVGTGGLGAVPIGSGGSAPLRCIAGTLQRCIGPTGCQGAQSCLADGSGYGPCACPNPTVCAQGQSQSCLGPGDCIGVQTCLPDGSGFGSCACPVGAGGTGGSGGSVVQVCVLGTLNPCYGTGNCLGSQRCLADGSGYAPCDCGTGGGTSGPTPLLPGDGYIQGGGVDGRIWGPWYTFGGEDSVFEPPEGEPVYAHNDQICFVGTVAQVIGGDYSTYYGAMIGFDLCRMPADMSTCDQWMPPEYCSWPPESSHTISECGIALNSISFDISGMLPSTELRAVFKERDRVENPYLVVAGMGPFRGIPTDATLGYNSSAPPLNLSAVEAIHFHVASMEAGPVPFDFCISNLRIE